MKLSKSLKNNSNSVKERVYEKIRMAILTGEILGGERLVELDLAEKMKSSRTPVREALQMIANEGLIYSIPRAGYIVDEMSEADLREIFEARTGIEQAAAKLAVERISLEEVRMIEKNIRESQRCIDKGLCEKMIEFDTEFHAYLCGASRNNRLIQFSRTLRDHLLKYRMIALRIPHMAKAAIAEHVQIFEAFQSRDHEILERSIYEHLESSKEYILTCLRNRSKHH
jgi:DNA-binding GntR family transcriptional regulator